MEIVGCKSAAAVHFSPSFCPIAGLWGGKSGKNCPRWGRFSLSTLQVRQPSSVLSWKLVEEKKMSKSSSDKAQTAAIAVAIARI
ncbi:MAG: hypothetical protein Q8O81_02955, partial [Giesbergeria sp.]|nr:hypothetical protein [Giesbergeria sp.]